MFRKKTVFIVGAGASKCYGLPIGADLKEQIASKLNIEFSPIGEQVRGSRLIAESLFDAHGRTKEGVAIINQHIEAGWVIANAMPLAISIDNLIHTHSQDSKIVKMGKLAIVESILDSEGNSTLFNRTKSNGSIDYLGLNPDWLNEFCRILTEDVTSDRIDHLFENVSVINFNYDRCVEYYVPKWLSVYYRIDELRAQEVVKTLKMIHPYGQAGFLPYQKDGRDSIRFGSGARSDTISAISDNIRTFTEQQDDDDLRAIEELISGAVNVVFLGFSFGRMNVSMFRSQNERHGRYIYGTRLGISKSNLESIDIDLKNTMRADINSIFLNLVDEDCVTMLRSHNRLLSD